MLYANSDAACGNCIKSYLGNYEKKYPKILLNIDREMEAFKSSDAVFYPHPSCNRHLNNFYKTNVEPKLQIGKISPFNRVVNKDINKIANLPYISVVSSSVSNADFQTPMIVGRGVDYNSENALLKAKMETLERICAYHQPRARLQYASGLDFGPHVLTIHKHLNQARWWIETTSLKNNKKINLPLEYCQLESISKIKNPFVLSSSAGMAIHYDRNLALRNAFFEVVEKIAITNLLEKKPHFKFNNDEALVNHHILHKAIQQLGYDITILYSSVQNILHAFLFLFVDRELDGKKPALVFGSGCNDQFEPALEHALLEGFAQLVHALEIYHLTLESRLVLYTNARSSNIVYDQYLNYFKPEQAKTFLSELNINSLPIKNLQYIDHGVMNNDAMDSYEKEILFVERGNILTDYLNLYVMQVLIPEQYPLPISNTKIVEW